jgi:hypothetical protein
MRLFRFALILASICQTSWAYEFYAEPRYNSTNMTLILPLVFDGTSIDKHQFSYETEPCNTAEQPNGLAIRVNDSGWEDLAERPLRIAVPVYLGDALAACNSNHVQLTIRIANKHRSMLIKR